MSAIIIIQEDFIRYFVHIHLIVQPHYEMAVLSITLSYKRRNGNFKKCLFCPELPHLGRGRDKESGN